MAEKHFSWLVSSLLIATFVVFNTLSVAAAREPASVHLDTSATITTAGQQIELALTIKYSESLEVMFNPQLQNWGEMQLLAMDVAPHRWVNGQWQYTVFMDTTFLMPGQYQTPVFNVDVFKDSEHWQLQTKPLPVEVLSAFDNTPVDIQDMVGLPGQQEAPSSAVSLIWIIIALFAIAIIWQVHQRRLPATKTDNKAPSPEDIAEDAQTTGVIDWEALRHWLMVTTGADPNGKLTADEPLLYRYQVLRFGQGTSLPDFIDYCNQCQGRWG